MKEGDGECILRCWKFALLIYKAHNHNKYALASLQLQAYTLAMLTLREAHSLTWNRTVNNKGGPGHNISVDLRMEHLINLTKGMLKNLDSNIKESAAMRCSKAVGNVEQLLDSVDRDLQLKKPSGYHKIQKSKADFCSLVNELHQRGKVFHYSPSHEREYQCFGNFQASVLRGIDLNSLNRWINHHKKEMHKKEPL